MQKKLLFIFFCFISLFTQSLFAHGSMEVPISRVYACFLEGPENLKSEACKAMITMGGGKQALYDWDMVNQFNANDQHRVIIPDGTLCAGGRDKYAGLNLPRADWIPTTITPDAEGKFKFVFRATVPHAVKYFELYLTKDSYNVTQPLKWSDLEEPAFCRFTTVTLENGRYNFDCKLPADKTGRRILYMIWQRSDSAEAFYSCSDVIISGETKPAWKSLDNLNALHDVTPGATLKFWLMRNCEEAGSYEVKLGAGQHTANNWPYYLAQGVNANSSIVNIGQLDVPTGKITPIQNAIGNKVYVKTNDTAPYFFILDYENAGMKSGRFFSAAARKQYCLAHIGLLKN